VNVDFLSLSLSLSPSLFLNYFTLSRYRDVDVVSGVALAHQIAALRPAPLAANFLGACGSNGDARIEHFLLSDALASPPELQVFSVA